MRFKVILTLERKLEYLDGRIGKILIGITDILVNVHPRVPVEEQDLDFSSCEMVFPNMIYELGCRHLNEKLVWKSIREMYPDFLEVLNVY